MQTVTSDVGVSASWFAKESQRRTSALHFPLINPAEWTLKSLCRSSFCNEAKPNSGSLCRSNAELLAKSLVGKFQRQLRQCTVQTSLALQPGGEEEEEKKESVDLCYWQDKSVTQINYLVRIESRSGSKNPRRTRSGWVPQPFCWLSLETKQGSTPYEEQAGSLCHTNCHYYGNSLFRQTCASRKGPSKEVVLVHRYKPHRPLKLGISKCSWKCEGKSWNGGFYSFLKITHFLKRKFS